MGTLAVESAFGYAIGCKVLQGGEHMSAVGDILALHSLNYGCGKHSGEIWVFAEGLFHTAPAWLAGNVDYGAITHARTLQTGFEGYHFAHAVHQCLIEGAGLRQRGGEHCGAYCHVSVRTFFGYKDRDAESGVLYGIFLYLVQCFGCKSGVQTVGEGLASPWVGAEHCPKRS